MGPEAGGAADPVRGAQGMAGLIHIGTSGWHYPHWRGNFYPPDLPTGRWLEDYARHFQTVEINNFFYHLPAASTIRAWRAAVPAGFLFAVKASRFITHMKKLKEPKDSLRLFLQRASRLKPKLGPVLFQLPPRWKSNPERLRTFLRALPRRGFRWAFEFRDASWFEPEIFRLLESHAAALCIYELAGRQSPLQRTAPWVYVRLHGPGGPYQGSYSDQALDAWADRLREYSRQDLEVYCYFDNDQAAFAARNALALAQRLSAGAH